MNNPKTLISLALLTQLRTDVEGKLDDMPESVLQLLGVLDCHERQAKADADFALNYPNLAKEATVKVQANEVFQFLEFLAEQGVNLARYEDGSDHLVGASAPNGKTGFIDQFYELDRKATETERTQLLEKLWAAAAGTPIIDLEPPK